MLAAGFCYPAHVKTLVCPHCQSSVYPNASVCTGCHAEIVRGASRKEKTTAGCLAMCIGLLVTLIAIGAVLPSLGAPSEKGFAVVVGLLLSAVLFNLGGRALARVMFRTKLRFFRAYQHR